MPAGRVQSREENVKHFGNQLGRDWATADRHQNKLVVFRYAGLWNGICNSVRNN